MNSKTITTAQIKALREEADVAGDIEQMLLCDDALRGDKEALSECARVIAAAAAAKFAVGDRVEGGHPGTDEYDTGIVHEINGGLARVGWDSGVTTPVDVADLRHLAR